MDLHKNLEKQMEAYRQESFKGSGQLTIGKIIELLSQIDDDTLEVYYDFEYLYPTEIDSWRGAYNELALNYRTGDRDNPVMKLKAFSDMMKNVIGETFIGYKGGDFTMSEDTPVWVANYGNSGGTAILDVIHLGHKVILSTGYREY